ncbi:hypothetical protein [Streptomyces agglomeratus]|uniref:hypothetical protein n=1 Tax=Streptomyces agglomeratus TaxID=285458 RepID=UPI001428BFD4|nr:hypothetical protein [Streptomyces agglomeratus]
MRAESESTVREVLQAIDADDRTTALRVARSAYQAADETQRAELLLCLGPRAADGPDDQ